MTPWTDAGLSPEGLFILLVLYQVKHFLADYPLQGKYMLEKFKDHGWVLPLLAHAAVHGAMTLGIALLAGRYSLALPLAAFDTVIHFTMDRLKAGSRYLGRFQVLSKKEYISLFERYGYYEHLLTGKQAPEEIQRKVRSNTYFWWSLGLDQMVHHLTHYACIWAILFW